jgi:1-acyl-sn-glycerol-3-phosphate acyltransferase
MQAPPLMETPLEPTSSTEGGREALRTVLSLWLWFEITFVSILSFLFALLARVLLFPVDRNHWVAGHVVRLASVAAVKLNPMWKFEVKGELPANLKRKTVIVSNHCSHTDPFLISHLPISMRWLAKASLFKIPFLGWSMFLRGDVAVKRGDTSSGKEALARCAEWLEKGVSVIIFPEGTRSRTAELLPFKTGAFRLAIETGADILPLAVVGTHTALRKHDWKAGYSRGLLAIGEPISTEGLSSKDVAQLTQQAREAILELRAQLATHA